MKLNCIIVDDEAPARKLLMNFIDRLSYLELLKEFDDPLDAINFLQATSVDLVFLDIQMPQLTGIEFTKALTNPPLIIMVTAYPEYAVQGFELDVIDYILKPFSFDRFVKAVNKALHLSARKKGKPMLSENQNILLKSDKKLYPVSLKDVLFFEAYGDYVKVHREDQPILLTKETLRHVESLLPEEHFIRTHRRYIVNKNAIEYIEGNMVKIGTNMIPVSQSLKTDLFKLL